jgi:hypothetical protein
VFNLGLGEVTVIALLLLIFLGPATLPDLAQAFRRDLNGRRGPRHADPRFADRRFAEPGRWRLSDWLLVAAVTVLAGMALALADVRG